MPLVVSPSVIYYSEQNPPMSLKALCLLQGWEGVLFVRMPWGKTDKQTWIFWGLNMLPRELTAEKGSFRPKFEFKFSANSVCLEGHLGSDSCYLIDRQLIKASPFGA